MTDPRIAAFDALLDALGYNAAEWTCERVPAGEPLIEDAAGSLYPARCPRCRDLSMEVVRPGKAQCARCG